MPFDKNKQAHTSSEGNNCLLNCLVPTLSTMLLDAAQNLDAIDSSVRILGLLQEFRLCYNVRDGVTSIELCNNLKSLLEQSCPQELEIIFAPVLRHYLGKLWELTQLKPEQKESLASILWNYLRWPWKPMQKDSSNDYFEGEYGFMNAVRGYLILGEYSFAQFSSFINPSLKFLQPLRETYAAFCLDNNPNISLDDDVEAKVNVLCADEENFTTFLKTKKNECLQYWNDEGFSNFWRYLSREGSLLTLKDIRPLVAALGISLEHYTNDDLNAAHGIITVPNSVVNLKLILCNEHWECEAISIDEAEKHNQAFQKQEQKKQREQEEQEADKLRPCHEKEFREISTILGIPCKISSLRITGEISEISGHRETGMFSVKSPIISLFFGISVVGVALVVAGVVLPYAAVLMAAAVPLLLTGVALCCVSGMILASIAVAKACPSCQIDEETTSEPPKNSRIARAGTPTITIAESIGVVSIGAAPDPVSAKTSLLIHNPDPDAVRDAKDKTVSKDPVTGGAMPIIQQPVGLVSASSS